MPTIGESELLEKYRGDRRALAKAVLRGEETSGWAPGVLGAFWIQVAEAALRLESDGIIVRPDPDD